MAKLLASPSKNAVQKALAAQLLSTATTGDPITFDDVDGIPNLPGVLVIRRVDGAGVATPSYREYIEYSGTSGTTVLITTRNVDGSNSALTHPVGSIVEFIPDVTWADRIYDALANLVDVDDLSINTASFVTPSGTQTITGAKTFSALLTASAGVKTIARVVTTTDDATAVIDVDITDQYQLSAVANATTFTVTGTPTDGQKLIIRFKDAGVAKGLTFTGFTAMGATIPTTTTAGKWGYVGCIYNSAATTWHVVVAQTEA